MFFSKDVSDLDCPVCLHRFHDPVILNCGHTIDRSCVQQMIDSSPGISPVCPLCRFAFDPHEPLISNQSLNIIVERKKTFEWFLIDISSTQETTNLLRFLKLVFHQRDIETDCIIFKTNETRLEVTSDTNFAEQLQVKPLLDLQKMLQEACTYLKQQHGVRKICLLTDGSTKHLNISANDWDGIHQRFIVHIGDRNLPNTHQFAEEIDFQFGHFSTKTVDIYAKHFLTNF